MFESHLTCFCELCTCQSVMADVKSVIIPLDGKNYQTWKIQCRMALLKDSLWDIFSETEPLPDEANADARRNL